MTGRMHRLCFAALAATMFWIIPVTPTQAAAGASDSPASGVPTWWAKYDRLVNGPAAASDASVPVLSAGTNVDVSNEDTPQSETSIAIDPSNSKILVAGSNEIVRLPMRGYFSRDGGATWGAVDLPLPPAATTNGTDFGSDPGVAFDSRGNVYYVYIVVFFNRTFHSVQGSEVAVAKSLDHGATWPQVTFFNFTSGNGKFNDKPMIAVDDNPASPHRDAVYVGWDSASQRNGKASSNNALLFSTSVDGGATFSTPVAVSSTTGGPNAVIGADPFVGPDGHVYVAWHDVQTPRIMVAASSDGGGSFGAPVTVSPTTLAFDDAIPAMATRGALVYPACGADRSSGADRGRLYCSWMDETASNGTDIFVASSSDRGATWSAPLRVNDDPAGAVKDQFNQWLAVDPTTGAVDLSWNDARNDPKDVKTDIYAASSTDGGASFSANVKVTTTQTDESAANSCAQAHDQYGDYEGIAAAGGSMHPVWTDGRFDCTVDPLTGLTLGEEVFTATVS